MCEFGVIAEGFSMETGCVYIGTINDKSYIGYTRRDFEKRKEEHLKAKDDYHFHCAIRLYGPENVEWRILEMIYLNIVYLIVKNFGLLSMILTITDII